MINLALSDFEKLARSAELIGSQYTYGGIGVNPSGRFLIEQYLSVALNGNVGDALVFQPGTPAFFDSVGNPASERAYLGNAYVSIPITSIVPATYTTYVEVVGVAMGSIISGEGLLNTRMRIWQSTNVVNTVQVGQTVLIEVPKIPFAYISVFHESVGVNVDWQPSFAFMGLQIKK